MNMDMGLGGACKKSKAFLTKSITVHMISVNTGYHYVAQAALELFM
jgi:hypothetical protein